jgi:hypothetical protein
MNISLNRRALALALLLAGSTAAATISACSSGNSGEPTGTGTGASESSSSGTGNSTGTASGSSSSGTVTPASCSTPDGLGIVFSPMYSAYEPTHTYQLPAVVNGVDPTTITWGSSDPTMVTLESDPATGGTMITMQKSGTVQIVATAGSLCGSATLTITAATPEDWATGNARYNDGTVLHFGRGDAGTTVPDAGGPACTNCHGPTADGGAFNDIAHTPEQTGGFSDSDLTGIVVDGVVPDGGYFDPTIISYARWQKFHQWSDIQGTEQQGIVVYLRSLTPTPQNGSANFGGQHDGGFPHDGGHRDGGFHFDASTD